MSTPSARPTEDELIARFFAPMAGEGGLRLLDDAARIVPPEGQDLVLTVDALVAGGHFFPDDPPTAIGRKALGVNMSDLAAKGAAPLGFLLTLALPDDWTAEWLAGFSDGLGEAAMTYRCPLLGGDTVAACGPFSISITAIGTVPHGRMVQRTTAGAGERICVTGTIGDAALGLILRRQPGAGWTSGLSINHRVYLTDRYLHPRPRLALASILREHASAAMDVSDGLAGDLAKMARASGLSAEVDVDLIPFSPAARGAFGADGRLRDRMITGGDDYEILCTVPDARLAAFLDACAGAGVPATVIGRMIEGNEPPVFRDGGLEKRYDRGSFSHF
jgi:thiamine-monophosphate kinase